MTHLNPIGTRLLEQLGASRLQIQTRTKQQVSAPKVHVVGAGASITAAYEQLRNAAEYAEEHVLLQRAIRRFYRRLFLLKDPKRVSVSGEDLIIELTHAGYLPNDSVPEADVQAISELSAKYYHAYDSLHRRKDVQYEQADQWTYELLAVEVEWRLSDTSQVQAYAQFCLDYFAATIEYDQLFGSKPDFADVSLYVAVHRALLKSDEAALRLGLIQRFQQNIDQLESYISINRQINTVLRSSTTEKLFRLVDRRGAPLRILRHMIEDTPDFEQLAGDREQLLHAYENQVTHEYLTINKKINLGIIKSVIFLIITKFLIGIAIEVPYDLLVFGAIMWLPLVINLLFPPIYMLLLRTTMGLPAAANTTRLVEQIDRMLYQTDQPKQLHKRPKQEFGAGYNVAYAVVFAVVFSGVAVLLWRLFGFDVMHLTIFFVFLSAASFLGFRLSRMIREIEALETYQNGVTLIRDFLYMPFVVVGRYISDKYSKVNIVALALDMLIELPLKTILRLVRQWAAFISAKKDQL